VCMDHLAMIMFLPCMHTVLCAQCFLNDYHDRCYECQSLYKGFHGLLMGSVKREHGAKGRVVDVSWAVTPQYADSWDDASLAMLPIADAKRRAITERRPFVE